MLFEVVDHDGQASTVRVSGNRRQGIVLNVFDPDDEECGQVFLEPTANGYRLRLRTEKGVEYIPFVVWRNEGRRLGDILPGYRSVLSRRTYNILAQGRIRNLRVKEFLKLLRRASENGSGGVPWVKNRRRPAVTLCHVGRRIGPKTITELARVFLDEPTHRQIEG